MQSRTALPDDLEAVSAQFAANEQAARELLTGLTREQANWRPDPRRSWSVVQCIDHLARTNDVYGSALTDAIQRAVLRRPPPRRGPLAPGWLARKILRSIEPPVRRHFASPPIVLPEDTREPQEALASLIESHDSLRRMMADAADLDLNRIRFRNPFLRNWKLFSVATGLLVLPAHERRHLWQARNVRERLAAR
ncbi:MAG TPA: DinB family protein [Bryobacteraceae bacterium]|nr:DinB family protein [Bryobacteraceae bacterium]